MALMPVLAHAVPPVILVVSLNSVKICRPTHQMYGNNIMLIDIISTACLRYILTIWLYTNMSTRKETNLGL